MECRYITGLSAGVEFRGLGDRMPHHGEYEHVKEWLQDHDTDEVNEAPPVQNTWYEVFDAEDVRLIWCEIYQTNTDIAAKDIEVRWTIDGNVYLVTVSLDDDTVNFIYRDRAPSAVGTAGLTSTPTEVNAGFNVDKRGLAFKVEVRMTSVPGTAQVLRCRCVRETLEVT